jgi:pyruvate,water dikinase
VEAAGPPDTLGEPEGPPPLDVFPPALRRATEAILAMIEVMEGVRTERPLHGVGVGSAPCRGAARVVTGADDALERLGPGEILVAPFTGPAYNSILPIVGGVVVEEGGPLCHAAIVARELGIPALVGVTDATVSIADGELIEVDPVEGVIRRVESDQMQTVPG